MLRFGVGIRYDTRLRGCGKKQAIEHLLGSGDRVSGGDGEATWVQDATEIRQSAELSLRRERPPAVVHGYEISHCLGEGAFGSVWLAREQNTGKRVAIKFYTHRRGLDWPLLNREVEKLAVLYTSRSIVRLLDVGWDADPPYYVMEYLENGSLSSFLEQGSLPAHEAVRIGKSVLHALVHAHGSGILHCDLKPANVLLDADFEPRLCDFGQSRLTGEQNPALGTLYYMAPEQADLNAVPDARWDVYALGALLYHMVCGEAPCRTAEGEQRIRDAGTLEERLAVYRRLLRDSPPPTGHRHRPGVDRRLVDIIDRCLQIDPRKRFPNAQAVLDMLLLRERYRSRRPLLVLGIVGPALLLLATTPFVYRAMSGAVADSQSSLTERALESDALPATILARSILRDLEERRSELARIADDPKLRDAVRSANGKPWPARKPMFASLLAAKQQIDADRDALNRPRDTSWFVDDAEGYQRWREPYDPRTDGKRWAHRDYFHGQRREYNPQAAPGSPDAVPLHIEPIHTPHISLAFRSQATGRYMVAISVPIWKSDRRQTVIGILARTMHLDQLLADYGQDISSRDRVVALVEAGDWKLLHHPWMAGRNIPDKTFARLTLDSQVADRLEMLDSHRRRGEPTTVRERSVSDYIDPVGREGLDEQRFGGYWLAAFAPVGDTGWTVIVQERRRQVLEPVDQMQWGMIRYGLSALVVSCGLIGLLWLFVNRALSERGLRIGIGRSQSAHRTETQTPVTGE